MNRRQKIIVSVVGIFIVLLALVGITYGYFLTRIQGNTNTTSITVTTADLKLVYGDGNGNITPSGVIMPDNNNFIMFSNNTDSKTFTVTNDGNATVENYVVVLEDISVTYASNATLEDGTAVTLGQPTTFNRLEDFVYVLSCKAYTGYSTGEQTELEMGCNGQETETVLPMEDSILVTNTIDEDVTHAYELKIKYLNPDIDQSKDMNKTFSMKLNIYNFNNYNPYSDNTDSLAYNILNNGINKTNGTELLAKPISNVAEEISSTEGEKILSIAMDNLGTSYYFRGNVEDNYVNFAEMCWRIVRINGDGSIKLVLEDQNQLCDSKDNSNNYNMDGNWNIPASNGTDLTIIEDEIYMMSGYFGFKDGYLESYLNPEFFSEQSMVNAFKYFQNNNLSGYSSKLTAGNWCLNDKAYNDEIGTNIIDKSNYYVSGEEFYYDSYVRLINNENTVKSPTFKCDAFVMNKFSNNNDMLVGTLTADEVMFAGGKYDESNENYYLINNHQKNNELWFWTLSPAYYYGSGDSVFSVDSYGTVNYVDIDDGYGSFRPAINLVNGIEISKGTGLQTDPYVITN